MPAHAARSGGVEIKVKTIDADERRFSQIVFGESASKVLMMQPCVYILASRRNGTLYIGVTSDLVKRAWEHKNDFVDGFTKQHGVHTLVWYEVHATMESAISREKALKAWRRAWKLELIEKVNPGWDDLYEKLI